MQTVNNAYLKYIDLVSLESWSVQGLLDAKFNYSNKYELSKIGDFLVRSREVVNIEDDKVYNRVTVKINNNGVILRDTEQGVNIGTKKQYLAKAGQFIISKIDARNGAFGVIPNELNHAIVTNDFPLFDVNKEKIKPQFLLLITTTKVFVKFAQSCSSGTTNRQRMDIDMFLNQKIPLPKLEDQEKIVRNYYDKIKTAGILSQQASNLGGEIEMYLFNELGIKSSSFFEKSKLLHFVNFEETNRWDTLFLLGKISTLKSKYNLVNFSEAIKCFNKDSNYKSIRVDSSKFPNEEFRYIGMEHVEKDTGRLLDMPIVKGKEIKSQTIKVPKGFIIYGKLRPYLNKYWVNQTDFDNIICSSEFFVFDIHSGINKLFFKNVLSSKAIQDQIADKTSGARMPRINEDIFFNLKFPLPPIEIQNRIASNISNFINKIDKYKLDAVNLKTEAEQEFEKTIFNS
jgi:type I restriction enzyme, S subunit